MNEYARFHRNGVNLLIHAATVPMFILAVLGAVLCPFLPRWEMWWGASVSVAVYSGLLQRFGHRLEAEQWLRPRGVSSGARRFLHEQFVAFPRFVLSGGWSRSWRSAGPLVRTPRRKR